MNNVGWNLAEIAEDLKVEVKDLVAGYAASKVPKPFLDKIKEYAKHKGVPLDLALMGGQLALPFLIRDKGVRGPVDEAMETWVIQARADNATGSGSKAASSTLAQAIAGLDAVEMAAFEATLMELHPNGAILPSDRGKAIVSNGLTAEISAESLKAMMHIQDPTLRREFLERAIEKAQKSSSPVAVATSWLKDLPAPLKKIVEEAIKEGTGIMSSNTPEGRVMAVRIQNTGRDLFNDARAMRAQTKVKKQ